MASRSYTSVTETTADGIPSADFNEFPRGEIIRRERTGRTVSTDGVTGVTSATITHGENDRQFQMWGIVTMRSSKVGGVSLRFHIDGVQVQRKNAEATMRRTDTVITMFVSVAADGDESQHTYALVCGISGTDGNRAYAIADDDHGTAMLIVNDMGPAYT